MNGVLGAIGGSVVFLLYLGLIIGSFGAWLQHLFTCFTNGDWGFLIAGALFFPIAIIHGLGIWLGWW